MVPYFGVYNLRGIGQSGDNPFDIQPKLFDYIAVILKDARVASFHKPDGLFWTQHLNHEKINLVFCCFQIRHL